MTHTQDTTPANPIPPGWPDPLESPQAEAIRNGKLDDTEIRNLFDCMERELRLHRERATNPAQVTDAMVEALAEFLCSEFDKDFNPCHGYSWPEHKDDDGYRGGNAYVKLHQSDVQARAREGAARILTFLSQRAALTAAIGTGETRLNETGGAQLLAGGKLGCLDCGEPYGSRRFPDLVIDNEAFAKIAPNPPDGGLLCPNCICARLSKAGLSNVQSRFTSGPLCCDAIGAGGQAVAWWHVGKWGNGTSCADESNIFCDAWETAIAENLPTEVAEAIVEAHNAALSQPHPAPSGQAVAADIEKQAWECDKWPDWLHAIVDRTNEVADRLDMSSEQAHAYAALSALSAIAHPVQPGWLKQARLIVEDVSNIQYPTRLSSRTVERLVFDARKEIHGDGNCAAPQPKGE